MSAMCSKCRSAIRCELADGSGKGLDSATGSAYHPSGPPEPPSGLLMSEGTCLSYTNHPGKGAASRPTLDAIRGISDLRSISDLPEASVRAGRAVGAGDDGSGG